MKWGWIGVIVWLYGQDWGIWTFQQVSFPIGSNQRWQTQFILQPRVVREGWETILGLGLLGYWFHPQHSLIGGGAWVEFYRPRRVTQQRMLWRWQGNFSPTFSTSITWEWRWEGGGLREFLMRPMIRYRLGRKRWAPLIVNELFYTHWSMRTQWKGFFRQERLWLALSGNLTKRLQVETGYLLIAAPKTPPRHRLWLALRWSP
ncbi:MAG: DUF2490 domain-containing protein [Bacteroidia bacterium]|nr:DUF2490 domain-containing protein [Bacteroidia bacterium]MDW8235260.1 DUF2490 domain-containing protein [Bacteroidia bacterium]